MRFSALFILGVSLLWPALTQAKVSAEDIEEVRMFICEEEMSIASHADNATFEQCKASFVKDGKYYEVAWWVEREEYTLQLRKGPVTRTNVTETLVFSIIELTQFAHFDGRRILEEYVSIEDRSGEVRSGMRGYAFEGGYNPPFDRYSPGDFMEDIPAEGLHLKPLWQETVEGAVQATLEHARSLRQQALLR